MTSNHPYIYPYVLNNPLSFTDPSGYRPVGIFEEESRMASGSYNSAGSGWDPFGWINNAPGLEPGWVNEAIYAHYVADNMNEMWANPHGGYWNTSMSRPHFFGSKSEAFNYAVSSNPDITVTAYSGGSLGSQDILYENATTGTATVVKTPFWEITGSYYNELYYFSGLVAYDISTASQSMQVPNLSIGAFHALVKNGLGSNLNAINMIAGGFSFGTSLANTSLRQTRAGSNFAYRIAYSKGLLGASKLLKPLGFAGAGINVLVDLYKFSNGQLPGSIFVMNTSVTASALLVGGWPGLGIVGLYSLGQYGYKMTMEGLEQGVIKPNPDMTRNYMPGLAPTPVIY